MTYSIVARDAATGELGVAVQSRAFGTGAACAWAQPGVGAVATQSFTERSYGPRGLELLAGGADPADALAELLAEDERREYRQVAFLAADGRTAAHTGAECIPACGDLSRTDVSAQGNMLASPEVWPAMVGAFAASTGPLGARLLDALDAGEAAGGDFRGRQAGGLVVVSGDPDEAPWQRRVDVRVDDHPEPLAELRRLYAMAEVYRRRSGFGEASDVEEEIAVARAAGLRDDEVALTGALVEARHGDLDTAARRLAPFAPRLRDTLERLERLGLLPAGVAARL